jgi:glycerol-3-phosphate dehydrogenase
MSAFLPIASQNAGAATTADVAVIGAGVVGCAIARSLSIRGLKVIVVEKAGDILEGASKGNSALLHTGFDEPPGSAELAMTKAGYTLYERIHHRMNLPLVKTGALVVAWDDEQLAKLPSIVAHAKANGIHVELVDREGLRRREPHLAGAALGAVLVPGESIIDPWSAPLAYLRQAILHGASLLTNAEAEDFSRKGDTWVIETRKGPVAARLVVNAAGLFGDKIEGLAGRRPTFTIRPRKGQFVVYDKPARALVNSIILRVPTERTKGILLAPTVFGNLLLGPTAEDQGDRIHATSEAETLRRLMQEGEAMLPSLAGQPVNAAFAGLRPATEHRDYVLDVDGAASWITVGGIRSTGLSASLGLGEWVAEKAAELLGRPPEAPPDDDLEWAPVPNLSQSAPRPHQQEGSSQVVCHCEWVTERELHEALGGPLPAGTLGGLKRRTRVSMGRCQGFGCSGAISRVAPHLVGLEPEDLKPVGHANAGDAAVGDAAACGDGAGE